MLLKTFILICTVILCSHQLNAQHYYPVAVTSSGILPGRYRSSNDAVNSVPVEISIDEAKNISALNALVVDSDFKLTRVKIASYQLTIHEMKDTTTMKNNSEILSKEMKARLSTIKKGAKLYFEGIQIEPINGETRQLILLSFIVN